MGNCSERLRIREEAMEGQEVGEKMEGGLGNEGWRIRKGEVAWGRGEGGIARGTMRE